ncbi:MAG: serine/threonine protein kinase, partial [Myxococcales bacterium]|nr:serine/threonine protein kinase [Myxococcales bacterium]
MGVVYAGYDDGLERKVALKLVRRELLDRPTVRERMQREAQAMACLSNPHVVQVYQVGEHAGGIYVAMEYIDGQTLGAWLRARPRPWQQVLRVVCDAGRGLAAAHRAGLVHRDFKPDNVLVDASDHARVLDFGLVQSEASDDLARTAEDGPMPADAPAPATTTDRDPARASIHWSVRLTQVGWVIGTPAYMSPEQHHGRSSGPASDQFSFSIALYEALYGLRPFRGDTREAIREQIDRGLVPPPPPDSRVPRWLFKLVARGLANDPAQRWPSLDSMLAALAHDPRRAWLRAASVVGLLAAATLGSYAATVARTPAAERCSAAAHEIAAVWSPNRRAAVARAFVATATPFAADTWERVDQRLTAYASAWASQRAAACEAHSAGLQSSALLDLRAACLERRKLHMRALIDLLTTADREVVTHAVQAVAALPGVQACS